MNLQQCQEAVQLANVDGWLLYDYRGQNPVAVALARQLAGVHQQPSRPWFCLIPAKGEPRWLVPRMERESFALESGTLTDHGSRQELLDGLRTLLDGTPVVAAEYAPNAELPSVSHVDAGTLELVRSLGVEVVSSAELVHWVLGRVDDEGLDLHRQAAGKLMQLKDEAFAFIADELKQGCTVTEWDATEFLVRRFEEEGLAVVHKPIVAAMGNSMQPHYLPMAERHAEIGPEDFVLFDIFTKVAGEPQAVYADITWCAYTGRSVPSRFEEQFRATREARDAALAFLRDRVQQREPVRGCEVDVVTRRVMAEHDVADRFIHRTGHNLGTEVHGWGVHLDGYETNDTRLITPGTLVTIEPGIYGPEIGTRSEINVYVGDGSVEATTLPLQEGIVALG